MTEEGIGSKIGKKDEGLTKKSELRIIKLKDYG